MALSYKRGLMSGDLVVPAGSIIKLISVPSAAVAKLVNGQVDAVLQPEEKQEAPYSAALDSTTVTIPASGNEAPTTLNNNTVPSFEQSISGQDNSATDLSKPGEEPIISFDNQTIEAPKAEEKINNDFSAPIAASDLLNRAGDSEVSADNQTSFINQSAIEAEAPDTSKVLQFPTDSTDDLDRVEETLETALEIVRQAKQKKMGTIAEEDQHKMAA